MPFSIHPSAESQCHMLRHVQRVKSAAKTVQYSCDEQGHQEQGISHVCHVHSAGRLEISVALRVDKE
jgi:hypothetical protein